MTLRRAYLAGPDVFWPDALARAEALKAVCTAHGFAGLFPLDQELEPRPGEAPAGLAARIRAANLELIRSAELVFAHVEPFRGAGADDGTAYEMGFAAALGRPVFAYGGDGLSLRERTGRLFALEQDANGSWIDPEGRQVEDFGLAVNLMLVTAETGGVHASLDAAAAAAEAWFARAG
jgi:nucleoside 2-deoxyribosyltransferase